MGRKQQIGEDIREREASSHQVGGFVGSMGSEKGMNECRARFEQVVEGGLWLHGGSLFARRRLCDSRVRAV